MSSKFKNKDGSLTMYALACGYIEEHKVKNLMFTLLLSMTLALMLRCLMMTTKDCFGFNDRHLVKQENLFLTSKE